MTEESDPLMIRATHAPANDNGRADRPMTIYEAIKAQHDIGTDAAQIVEALIEATARCTVTWGCDVNQVCEMYRKAVIELRGRGT
jgi:hypothetical protein